jgi:hypothetical protein
MISHSIFGCRGVGPEEQWCPGAYEAAEVMVNLCGNGAFYYCRSFSRVGTVAGSVSWRARTFLLLLTIGSILKFNLLSGGMPHWMAISQLTGGWLKLGFGFINIEKDSALGIVVGPSHVANLIGFLGSPKPYFARHGGVSGRLSLGSLYMYPQPVSWGR